MEIKCSKPGSVPRPLAASSSQRIKLASTGTSAPFATIDRLNRPWFSRDNHQRGRAFADFRPLAIAEDTLIEPILVLGIPVDFILFALTLLGVALFHRHTLPIALTGLAVIIVYKLPSPDSNSVPD